VGFLDKFKNKKEKHKNSPKKESKKIEIITDPEEIARINKSEGDKIRAKHQEELKKFKQKQEEEIAKKELLKQNQQTTCFASECTKEVDFFSGKKCKFCKKLCCFEHIQLEKHDCPKITPTKFIRKTWLRKYGVNISSGRYIVVCDDCGFISQSNYLIDIAGEKRKHRITNNNCNLKKVWLEEVLSEIKFPKNIDFEQIIPSDRTFWVCSHCRPPQKFTDRTEYIAHHYRHS
jgi:hypothetical protein